MIVIGLTGSIAMGKSTAATMFRQLGVPVYDADRAVHSLLGPHGAAIPAVEAAFPGVVRGGAIDRNALAQRVFADDTALERLEALLHPLIYREVHTFLGRSRRERRPVVVLDVPLLLETGGEGLCDLVAVVSAPRRIQAERLARRPGLDASRVQAIAARQMADAEKRARADVVIPTGLGKAPTMAVIRRLVDDIRSGAQANVSRSADG